MQAAPGTRIVDKQTPMRDEALRGPRGIRLFLVEDHQMLRDCIHLTLCRSRDIEVVGEASSCREALAGIRKTKPDIVITNYTLPDGDGLDLLTALKAEDQGVRVILFSHVSNRAVVRAALSAGARGFLTKEARNQDLVTAVRNVFSGETYLSPSAMNHLVECVRPQTAAVARLSLQEITVLRGIASGKTYKEIALSMNISCRSVETYRARLARKTGLRSKVALARFAAVHELAPS